MNENTPSPGASLHLDTVTLVAVTGIAHAETMAAMHRSLEQVRFARALLLSDVLPAGTQGAIAWRRIAPLGSYRDYSRFVLNELGGHIETTHALLVQWDGFVIDAAQWTDAFLEYDYVGAPWLHFGEVAVVGNGGFSLRSRRLLAACAELALEAGEAEDVALCRRYRPLLERDFGLRFAPVDLAARFSFETGPAPRPTFGFHGVRNLPQVLGNRGAEALLCGVDSRLVRRGEARDLAARALLQGRIGLARAMAARWRGRQPSGEGAGGISPAPRRHAGGAPR